MNMSASSGSAANVASSSSTRTRGRLRLHPARSIMRRRPRASVGCVRRRSSPASSASGSTASASPARATRPGISHTTLVASSCTDHAPPGAGDGFAAAQAVLAHAGQHQRQRARAVGVGHRSEQHVRGRTMRVLGRLLVEHGHHGAVAPLQRQVEVARGDVDHAGLHRLSVGGLDHRERGLAVEPLGEEPGEHLRHVRHDHHRRAQSRRAAARGFRPSPPGRRSTG